MSTSRADCRASNCSHYYRSNQATLIQRMREGFTTQDGSGIHWLPTQFPTGMCDESWREHLINRRDGEWVDGWWVWEDRPGWFTGLRWEPADEAVAS